MTNIVGEIGREIGRNNRKSEIRNRMINEFEVKRMISHVPRLISYANVAVTNSDWLSALVIGTKVLHNQK